MSANPVRGFVRASRAEEGSWPGSLLSTLPRRKQVRLQGLCAATGDGRALRVRRFVRADDEFSSGVSFSLVPQRIGHVAQCVAPLEDWGHLVGFNKLLQ